MHQPQQDASTTCASETTPLLRNNEKSQVDALLRQEREASLPSNTSTSSLLTAVAGARNSTCEVTDDLDAFFYTDLDDVLRLSDVFSEAKSLIPLSLPVSAGYILRNSIFIAAVFFLGRHSTQALAAMALCTLFCNVTGFSIGIGMASALDTLCSQAYGEALKGNLEKKELGRHLQRGILILALLCVPITVLWCFTESILVFAGQSPEIASLSGKFALCMIPGLFPYFVSEAVKRFLQSQGIMSASMVIILVVSPINIILQYILVWSSWNIGVLGAPIAISCSYWILAILMILYVLFVRGGDCWGGIESRELFCSQKLWQFTSLGAPGIAMLASEWWAFEIVALGSGLLGESYLAAQTIVLNTCGLTYMIPLGFSIAATARIGNALGAECPNRARASAFGALAIGQCLALVNSLVLFAIKDSWGLLWTEDVTVVKIVAEILPLAAVFQISDASGAISGGVLRGIGRQEIGAYLNILAYYFIGLPFGFYACFPLKLGLFGLWLGLTVGLIMVSAIQIVIIFRTDWNLESQRAHDLVFSKPLLDHDESGSRTPENV